MSLNETIRKRRKELSLTQAGIAKALGVSTPAVNKWEKGIAFPEVSLLPPLARLLKIDLNTLLSFNKDLSVRELEYFLEELQETMSQSGYEESFRMVQKKIYEYPQNALLISSTIPYMDSKLQTEQVENREYYEKEFENYYKKLIACEEIEIREIGISMYILNLMRRKKYQKAEHIIDQIPETTLDKSHFKEQLYFRSGKVVQAKEIACARVLSNVIKTQQSLLDLLDLAILSEDEGEVKRIVRIYRDNIKNYELPKCIGLFLDFRLALARNDLATCVRILESCLNFLKKCKNLREVFELELNNADLKGQLNVIQNYLLNIDKIDLIKENEACANLLMNIREELTRFV